MPRYAYETDFAGWAAEQAQLLRAGKTDELDLENIAEEIDSLSRSDRREILSRMIVLLTHLLKWRHQPEGRCASWEASMDEARWRIEELIEESPSLARHPAETLDKAYAHARRYAERETGLDMPTECPWTAEEALTAALD